MRKYFLKSPAFIPPHEVAQVSEETAESPNIRSEQNTTWRSRIKHITGLDWAIVFTASARILQILGSTGTVLLIVRFLTPVEQGYYYTLYSLVSLQVVFELGFSFVILQLAAHETAHLRFLSGGRIQGSAIARRRLASVLQKVRRWYSAAAALMFLLLAPAGIYFFARHSGSNKSIEWIVPWILLILMSSLMFQVDPLFSFLEGCGQVAEVARMRMRQTVAGIACAWAALISGHGLFAPAATLVGHFTMGTIFLWPRRKFLLTLLRTKAGECHVSWGKEIWPFQWKIAVSWLCNYFTAQIFTPVLFSFCGAAVAGQMGMSISIVGSLGTVSLAWMTTKAAPFGMMIQRRQTKLLNALFFKTLLQSTILITIGAVCLVAGVRLVEQYFPKLGARMLPAPLFGLLALTAIGIHIVQSEALFLRAHKSEPFLIQSIVLAFMVTGAAVLFARRYGEVGVTWGYFLAMGLFGAASGTMIFRRKRREWGYSQ